MPVPFKYHEMSTPHRLSRGTVMSEVPDSPADPGESISEEASSKSGMLPSLLATEGWLVRVAGSVMVVAALMSWVEMGVDAHPNVAGVGPATAGAGLVVMVVGLLLLLRRLGAGSGGGSSAWRFHCSFDFHSPSRDDF